MSDAKEGPRAGRAAAALAHLGGLPEAGPARDAEPTVARGHNLVLVAPPAAVYAAPALAALLDRLTPGQGLQALVLAPAHGLDDWAGLLARLAGDLAFAHATPAARAARLLREGRLDLLLATPDAALSLQRRSALKADTLSTVLLAWPEAWEDEASVAPLMQDLDKDTQRIVCTADPAASAALVERYARRGLTVGAPPAEAAPPAALGPVRTVTTAWAGRARTLSDALAVLDPATAAVWTATEPDALALRDALRSRGGSVQVTTGDPDPADVVIAYDVPSRERLRALLAGRRERGEVVLLVPPIAEPYVAGIAAPRRPLRLPGLLEEVQATAAAHRSAIIETMVRGTPAGAWLALAPLFERHEPAQVAAALYALWQAEAGAERTAAPPAGDAPSGTVKVYVSVGKKEGVTPNDLVATLTKTLRVDRTRIGRIELRPTFSLIELPAAEAERIAAALTGTTIRQRRVTARVDRGPTPRG